MVARRTVRTTQTPSGVCELHVPELGTVKGLLYPNGVRQFLGIPYARLAKRWTRSTLATSWPENFHDGRDLGSQAPNPPECRDTGDLTPIDTFAHLTEPVEDEATCLVVNIVLPPLDNARTDPYPVMFYIHGGSLVFGGGNRAIFDSVNLVSKSMTIGKPVIAINMNYRVGLGGFLASKDILEDMKKDGLEGVGNWGLTDQQTALEWVQRYIPSFNGDKTNVTVFGLSAGGISIGHQLRAKNPPIFHRAICMSGVENTIPTMSLEEHEKIYRRLLKYFNIDASDPNALEQLRAVPQLDVADATFPVYALPNIISCPCDDGVFHISPSTFVDYKYYDVPKWLKSYWVGDVGDEGDIFVVDMDRNKDYSFFEGCLSKHMEMSDAAWILEMYGLRPDSSPETCDKIMKQLFADCAFGIHQRKGLQASTLAESYGYHFDLVSKIKTSFYGSSFHALDLQYVFLNMHDDLDETDLAFGHLVSEKYIRFAYGIGPWDSYAPGQKWGIFTPDYDIVVKTENEDDSRRRYSIWDQIEARGLMTKFFYGYRTLREHWADS